MNRNWHGFAIQEYLENEFQALLQKNDIGPSTVVAIKGVGSLFGFLKVKDVVDKLAPMVNGRLLEPELQKVTLPARTLKTQADVDDWLDQARKLLMDKLSQGPILV